MKTSFETAGFMTKPDFGRVDWPNPESRIGLQLNVFTAIATPLLYGTHR